MATASKNSVTEHSGHWVTTAAKSGLYEFATGGKFVDRNIDLNIPKATETVSGSASGSGSIPESSLTYNEDTGKFTASQDISVSGTATATVGTQGFTDDASYSGSVSGSASASITLNEAVLLPSGSATTTTITSVTVGDKANGKYLITGSKVDQLGGTASVSVTRNGYVTTDTDIIATSFSTTANLNATINAAAATVTGSATVKPSGVTPANGNAKLASTTATTTAPSSGYYIAVTPETASSTTITQTKAIQTEGYLRSTDEITATGTVTGGNGSKYYVSLQSAGTTASNTVVDAETKVATRGTYNISEGYINETDGDLAAASFSSTASAGTTYVDISDTTEAPVLVSGSGLYINKGYVDNLYISLKQLAPDEATIEEAADGTTNQVLSGYSVYNNDGKLLSGTIPTKTAAALTASGKTVTVPSGYYATDVTKDVASGSVNSYTINETSQANVIASVSDTTPTSGYYPVSVASLTGTVNRTAGYIAGTTSTAADSNGGVVGKIKAATVSESNKPATASASASSTNNLASDTYTTAAATGYTYHIDTSASASVSSAYATATVSTGYLGAETSATASIAGVSKSSSDKVYLLDGTITNNTTGGTSVATITSGKQIKISKGYYPKDKYYTAQSFTQQAITGSLSSSISGDYTAPTLKDSATGLTAYVTLTGNGSMTAGNQYNGTANAKTQYMEVYTGTFTIS